MAYFSSCTPFKKLTLTKNYSTGIEAIAVECNIGRREMLVLALYRPPQRNTGPRYQSRVQEELDNIFQWASLQRQILVVVGDLNLDRLEPDKGEGKILVDLEEVNGLHCMINEPTSVTTHSESLLDVLLTNTPEMFNKCGVYQPLLSDHYLIFGEMVEKVCKRKARVIESRYTKDTDFELLNKDLLDAPWHVGEIFNDVDDMFDFWTGLTEFVIDVHAPIRRKRVRGKDIPYMTPEWKKAIRDKRKFAIKFAKERTEENFALKKKYRNIATRERRKVIRAYWHTKSNESNTRPGAFYDTYKPFISDKTKEAVPLYLKKENGSLVKDQSEVADMLSTYFTNVAKDIGGDAIKSLDNENLEGHYSIVAIRNAYGGDSFDVENITTSQVQRALEDLTPKKVGRLGVTNIS